MYLCSRESPVSSMCSWVMMQLTLLQALFDEFNVTFCGYCIPIDLYVYLFNFRPMYVAKDVQASKFDFRHPKTHTVVGTCLLLHKIGLTIKLN